MGMIVISAVAKKNRVIGTENGLPWSIPEEYQHFLEKTKGHPVIMGKTTYKMLTEGHGKDYESIPESKMFVVSRTLAEKGEHVWRGADVCGSLEEAMRRAEELDDIYFCAGGASIYKEVLDKEFPELLFISEVYGDYNGTAYFPEIDKTLWKETKRERHVLWDFVVYEKNSD